LSKKKIPSLIVERASDTGNLFLLSVLEYQQKNYLVVVDNITEDEIGAYVLDFAQQERIDLKQLMTVIIHWFYAASDHRPLSFELSRIGISPATNRIYKTFELAHVTRLVGNDFRYDMSTPPKIRRRRVQLIPAGTEIKLKRTAEVKEALTSLQSAITACTESEAPTERTAQLQPQALASASESSKPLSPR
jgi:hypothetical protein